MIYDSIKNLHLYGKGELWEKICATVCGLSADSEVGRYPIEGDIAFCKVMEYATSPEDQCRIEGHRKYIDIQFTLYGAEGIDLFLGDILHQETEYDEQEDVTFYTTASPKLLTTQNSAGFFTLLLPHDFHRPQLVVPPYKRVRKGVVKVKYTNPPLF